MPDDYEEAGGTLSWKFLDDGNVAELEKVPISCQKSSAQELGISWLSFQLLNESIRGKRLPALSLSIGFSFAYDFLL